MNFEISHRTYYRYSAPVSQSHHLLHLAPRPHDRQTVLRHSLLIDPAPASRKDLTDSFGNPASIITIEQVSYRACDPFARASRCHGTSRFRCMAFGSVERCGGAAPGKSRRRSSAPCFIPAHRVISGHPAKSISSLARVFPMPAVAGRRGGSDCARSIRSSPMRPGPQTLPRLSRRCFASGAGFARTSRISKSPACARSASPRAMSAVIF